MSPCLAPDYETLAAGLLANVLRYHQSVILSALFAEPAAVPDDPPTPERLSEGLAAVIGTFGQILQYPDSYGSTVEHRDADVVVSLTAAGNDVGAWALGEMSEADGRPVSPTPRTLGVYGGLRCCWSCVPFLSFSLFS